MNMLVESIRRVLHIVKTPERLGLVLMLFLLVYAIIDIIRTAERDRRGL